MDDTYFIFSASSNRNNKIRNARLGAFARERLPPASCRFEFGALVFTLMPERAPVAIESMKKRGQKTELHLRRRAWSGEIKAGFASRWNACCRYAICPCMPLAGDGEKEAVGGEEGGRCFICPSLCDKAMFVWRVVLGEAFAVGTSHPRRTRMQPKLGGQ